MDTIFTTDKNNKKRYLDISVEEINEVWCIVKTTGQVNGKETKSMTEVPLGYDSATKRAKTIWKNANTKATTVLPMLANKWEDRQKYISEPFYVQPKLDGVRLLVSKDGGISRTGKIIPGTEILGKGLESGQYVDGEAFDPNLNFEELTSTFKTDPLKLKFHVFDFFDLRAEALAREKAKKQAAEPAPPTNVVQMKERAPIKKRKNGRKNCANCGTPLTGQQRKFCSKKCSKKHWNKNNNERVKQHNRDWYQRQRDLGRA